MRVTFVLPARARVPQGGTAVVFRHAQGLAARGHRVTVVSPVRTGTGWRGAAWAAAVWARDRWHRTGVGDYYAAAGVQSLVVGSMSATSIPVSDAVIATGVQTARPVASLPPSTGRKLYFIQGDERFADPDARETWALPMTRLTCANWLAREVRASGHTVAAVVPNAVDGTEFAVDVPVADRPTHVVALYHRHPVKGPDVLIEALAHVLAERPGTRATVFSARPPSHRLPQGVEVVVRPDRAALRRLFNSASVFVHPSRSEGWPLVPMEAAACGCAVAGTLNPGVLEYLTPGVSMQPAPLGDGAALGQATLDLLRDDGLRRRLAAAAGHAVASTSWQTSTDRFEEALVEAVGSAS